MTKLEQYSVKPEGTLDSSVAFKFRTCSPHAKFGKYKVVLKVLAFLYDVFRATKHLFATICVFKPKQHW